MISLVMQWLLNTIVSEFNEENGASMICVNFVKLCLIVLNVYSELFKFMLSLLKLVDTNLTLSWDINGLEELIILKVLLQIDKEILEFYFHNVIIAVRWFSLYTVFGRLKGSHYCRLSVVHIWQMQNVDDPLIYLS